MGKGSRVTVLGTFKAFDLFGHKVELNVDGKQSQKTSLGAFVSIILILTTLVYVHKRFYVMMNYQDTIYAKLTELRANQTEIYHQNETKFNVAFTIAGKTDWQPHEVDMEGYLEWKLQHWKWEPVIDEKGDIIDNKFTIRDLNYHRCSSTDRKLFYE